MIEAMQSSLVMHLSCMCLMEEGDSTLFEMIGHKGHRLKDLAKSWERADVSANR